VLVLHHQRLDHDVLVDAESSSRRARAALWFVAVLVFGEGDLVLPQLALCGSQASMIPDLGGAMPFTL